MSNIPKGLVKLPRRVAAIGSGRLVGTASRKFGRGGGTAVPGLVSLALCPDLFRHLAAQLPEGYLLISGTNGKTTTSNMTASILRHGGYAPIANATGSNLLRGLTTSIIQKSSLLGRLDCPQRAIGLFEVDEAVLPQVVNILPPRAIVLTNLFRDQLDRYGEMDRIANMWRESLQKLDRTSLVLLNADDPLIASLGRELRAEVIYFGVDGEAKRDSGLEHAADSRRCPDCGHDLTYSKTYYGHLGHYSCNGCGFARPDPDIVIKDMNFKGLDGTEFSLTNGQSPPLSLRVSLPGLYNVYNALAAASAGFALGIGPEDISAGLVKVSAVFGRAEQLDVEGRHLHLMLVKNPAGMNETLRTLNADGKRKTVIFILNDKIADGRDVSWIWDVDFESHLSGFRHVIASGSRTEDMALRLKYSGIEPERLTIERDINSALLTGISQTASGEDVFVLPTYTAMLEFRQLLNRWGLVSPYWEKGQEAV